MGEGAGAGGLPGWQGGGGPVILSNQYLTNVALKINIKVHPPMCPSLLLWPPGPFPRSWAGRTACIVLWSTLQESARTVQ